MAESKQLDFRPIEPQKENAMIGERTPEWTPGNPITLEKDETTKKVVALVPQAQE